MNTSLGCGKNLGQPGNEPFEPDKNNKLCHKSDFNFKFLPFSAIFSRIEQLNEPGNLRATWLLSTSLPLVPACRSGYCYLNKEECNLYQLKDDSFSERVAKNNS